MDLLALKAGNYRRIMIGSSCVCWAQYAIMESRQTLHVLYARFVHALTGVAWLGRAASADQSSFLHERTSHLLEAATSGVPMLRDT